MTVCYKLGKRAWLYQQGVTAACCCTPGERAGALGARGRRLQRRRCPGGQRQGRPAEAAGAQAIQLSLLVAAQLQRARLRCCEQASTHHPSCAAGLVLPLPADQGCQHSPCSTAGPGASGQHSSCSVEQPGAGAPPCSSCCLRHTIAKCSHQWRGGSCPGCKNGMGGGWKVRAAAQRPPALLPI